MRKLILLFFFVSSALWLHAKDFTRYVSPLVGTQSTFELSTGNTYPAIIELMQLLYFQISYLYNEQCL